MISKLEKIVESNQENIAYVINKDKITYLELWNKANQLALSLRKQGISPIIIYGHKTIEMIISIVACLIAKRAYVPIDLCTPISRIEEIVKTTKSTLIIKNEQIDLQNIDCMSIDEINNNFINNNEYETSSNDLAYIIFTSGSTGNPKGVPISYENLENFISWITKIPTLKKYKNINVLNQASFSFDLSVADIYFSFYSGHTLIALDKKVQEDYNEIFNVIYNNKINLMVVTPTFMKMCLLNKEFDKTNFPNLKSIYFCGEQLGVDTAKKVFESFPNISILNAYGPTEATSAVCATEITKEMLRQELMPAGDVNTAAVQITIENEEIILNGKSVFNDYIDDYQSSFQKGKNISAYHTGDLGYIEDNHLYCKGRIDNQIKYKGYRIELGDIENNILKINGVKETVVIAKYNDDTRTVKIIKAFITTENNIDENTIKKELSKIIPNYMMPKKIEIIDKIPMNNNGKYDRKKLQEL